MQWDDNVVFVEGAAPALGLEAIKSGEKLPLDAAVYALIGTNDPVTGWANELIWCRAVVRAVAWRSSDEISSTGLFGEWEVAVEYLSGPALGHIAELPLSGVRVAGSSV